MIAHLLLNVILASATVRDVKPHSLTSKAAPRVRISLPQNVRYVGNDHFTLYGIADCDIYAFVDADAQKRVQRLYWLQFEGYIPSMRKLHHRYTSKRHEAIAGMDFYADTWTEQTSDAARPTDLTALKSFIRSRGYAVPKNMNSGSDEEHVLGLLRRRGYVMPPKSMSVRLVHVMDAARKELMIIYTEPAASTRTLNATEQEELVRRALSRVTLD